MDFLELYAGNVRTWVIQEADFQTIAAEAVHGLSGKVETETISTTGVRNRFQRTSFGDIKGNRDVKKLLCKVCGSSHGAWNCTKFIHLSLPDRCLGDNHFGRSCPKSRQCGQNGCNELHHKLLHNSEYSEQKDHHQMKQM